MKVYELIERLKEYPCDAYVCFEGTYSSEQCDIMSIDFDSNGYNVDASDFDVVMLNTTA